MPARFLGLDSYDVEDRGHDTPCWIWRGKPDGANGYGRIRVNGMRWPAHRYFYVHHRGPIPSGLVPDHLCCVSLCVNPWHLEPVTITENNRRRRFNLLTMEQAQEIRAFRDEFFAARPVNVKGRPRLRFPQGVLGELAEKYGCSKITIISVLKERTWC